MNSIDFFCFKLPVTGEPEAIDVGGMKCKFWEVVCEGHPSVILRTSFQNGQWSSLQERLDNFVRKESGASASGYYMIWARYIRPANLQGIADWKQDHLWL